MEANSTLQPEISAIQPGIALEQNFIHPATPPPAIEAEQPATGTFGLDDIPPPPPGIGGPIFPEDPAGEDAAKAGEQARRMAMPLETILQMRSKLQAQLLALIAKSNDTASYEYSEKEMDLLIMAWTPYADVIRNGIPPIVVLLGVELFLMGKKIVDAIQDGKTNKSNAKLRSSPDVAQAMAAGAVAQEGIERRMFKVDKRGFYTHKRGGRGSEFYLRLEDRTEKADLKDIQSLLTDNSVKELQNIFGTDAVPDNGEG